MFVIYSLSVLKKAEGMEGIGEHQKQHMFHQIRQVAALGAKSAVSDCILLFFVTIVPKMACCHRIEGSFQLTC